MSPSPSLSIVSKEQKDVNEKVRKEEEEEKKRYSYDLMFPITSPFHFSFSLLSKLGWTYSFFILKFVTFLY